MNDRRSLLGVGLLLAWASGCGAAPPETRTPAPSSIAPQSDQPSAAVAPERAPESSEPQKDNATATVAEALELVARVRGLAVKSVVPGVRMARDALRAEVSRLLTDETPKEAIDGNAECLFALDTVPADFDFAATLAELYSAELAGFYDPKAKHMVLATDLGEDAERMTLYHELVHALQDQHFDLEHAFDWKPESSDQDGALHAVAEGDATSAMTDIYAAASGTPAVQMPVAAFKIDQLLLQASPRLAHVPGIIARSMIVPYVDGLAFVRYLREHAGGWAGVDRALAARPASTEQVLHPEKYLAGEPVIALPPLQAPPGFSEASFRDVVGEQGLRVIFEEWAPAGLAAEGAAGWGGDRIAVFTDGERRVVRWHLVFDRDADARRAFGLFARGAVRPEQATPEPRTVRPFGDRSLAERAARSDRVCQFRPTRGAFAAVRHGRHIGVTLGPYLRANASVTGIGDCATALASAAAIAGAR